MVIGVVLFLLERKATPSAAASPRSSYRQFWELLKLWVFDDPLKRVTQRPLCRTIFSRPVLTLSAQIGGAFSNIFFAWKFTGL
jgi:hypothetical protein